MVSFALSPLLPLHFFSLLTHLTCNPFRLFLFAVFSRQTMSSCPWLPGIGTQDGSATREEDFRGKSQRQVQFNPGQAGATWRVRILSDGKYEQAETFQILLSEPVMAVMEFPAAATVEILDPSDGQCQNITRTLFKS